MEATPITILFNGDWDERDVYSNYKTAMVAITHRTTISQLTSSIAASLERDETLKVNSISLYRDGTDKGKAITMNEDRDVQWMYNGFVGGMYNDYCILAEIVQIRTSMYNSDASDGLAPLKVGAMLPTKDDLKKALCNLALSRSFQFKTIKSSKKQFTACCIHETCNWYVRASVYRGGGLWVIRKFIDSHTCPVDVVQNQHMQATPLIISGYAESVIQSTSKLSCTPGDVMKHAKKTHGVNIIYYKAMNSKERALELMRGRPEDSYAFLAEFVAKLTEKNPGSYTAHEVDDDDRFKYFFMSMAASIQGCEHCLPAISVDGASLKNKFAGTMITACTFDGNASIYPLAFGILDSENDASWEWFFRNLKAVFGDHKDLIIVSDRHPSIENGFSRVYGAAHQAICIFHLLRNIRPGRRSEAFTNTYFNCAKAYNPEDYEYHIRHLEQMAPNVRTRLEEAGLHRWARAFALKNRYMLMTTNVSESLNAHLVHARELPIISLLEHIRDFMQRWFYERRNNANFQQLDISQRCTDILRGHLRACRTMDVYPINNSQYEVRDHHKHYEVDIGGRTCTCKQWQTDLIPCPHACSVITHKGFNLHAFVHEFYKISTLRKLYAGDIRPIGTSHHSPPSDESLVIHPPNVRRPVGRPRKRRIRSHTEASSRVKCGRCGRSGHNRRTCKGTPRN